MGSLKQLQRLLDALAEYSGRLVAGAALLMAPLMAVVVLLRYGFDSNPIALQEAVLYLHAALFLLGSAYTLKHGGHVRVDIFYRRLSVQGKAWVDSLGILIFLLPLTVFIFFISWDYVLNAWRIREVSTEPGGIPGVFVLKTLIPLAAALLFLQGVSELLRNLCRLMLPHELPDDSPHERERR